MSSPDSRRVRATVIRCWAATFGEPEDSLADDSHFFANGGDSLLAIELVAEIAEALSVDIPPDALFLDGHLRSLIDAAVAATGAVPSNPAGG